MKNQTSNKRFQLVTNFLSICIVIYLLMIIYDALILVFSGKLAAVFLGLTLILFSIIGVWIVSATLLFKLKYQQLSDLTNSKDTSLNISLMYKKFNNLSFLKSKIADNLLEIAKAELIADPYSWVRWYRLSQVYIFLGRYNYAYKIIKTAVKIKNKN